MNINDITITSLETINAFDIVTGAYKFTLDELQNATIAQTQEKTDITGKQGRKLNSLKKNKAVTVSGTNGLVSGGLLELQVGSEFENKKTTVKWTDYLTVTGNAAATQYKAVGTTGNEIESVYVKNANGTLGKTLTQGAEVAEGVFTYNPTSKALAFNEAPMVLNLFPSGQEAQSPAPAEMPLLTLSPAPVVLTACKRTEDGADTLLRLFNPTGEPVSCTVCCPQLGVSETLGFGAFQVRTFRAGDGRLTECRMDEAEKADV